MKIKSSEIAAKCNHKMMACICSCYEENGNARSAINRKPSVTNESNYGYGGTPSND